MSKILKVPICLRNIVLYLVASLLPLWLFGQQHVISKAQSTALCGTFINRVQSYTDASLKGQQLFQQIAERQSSRLGRGAVACQPILVTDNLTDTSDLYTIPVVFHIITDDPYSITDAMVMDALVGMNQAFAHEGDYSVDTNGVNTRINFCLARTHPNGGVTTGITRTPSFYGANDADLEPFRPSVLQYWDPARYLNIWVVGSIQGEIMPSSFSCGSWVRMGIGGYAAAGFGAVVGSLGVPLLAHEVGHYLSLLHTFAGGCPNNDCLLDGDLVCDTPPDGTTAESPCINPENSCSTDVISGPFTFDVRDNISNFMDYGSPCPTVFTRGQGERMRAFIELFNNGSLIDTTFCSSGCLSSITAKFSWGPDLYPVTGDSVFFTNESVGGYLYKWYIDSVLIDSTFNFRYRFDTDGVYEIMLKVSDSNDSCFANYSVSLEINCGVVARFSPNKRIIAAQTDVYSDPVTFFNKSRGATSYKWYVTNPATGQPQMISTSRDLVYDFPQPGSYSIFLEAANGACIDRSSSFNLPVLNPRPDGYVNIKEVDCYKKDSIRLVLEIGNLGYDTIPAGKEITFYDRDPRLPGASRVFNSYITSQNLIGKCSTVVTHIVSAIRPRLDTVFAYLDELRTFDESSFDNNIVGVSGFQFRVSVTPPVSTVNVNTTVSLGLNTHKGPPAIIRWTSAVVPSCLQCASPQFRITDTTLVKGYAENIYQCPDSATAIINVFPLDATVSVDSIHCYRNDSLRLKLKFCLRNNYQKIKYDLKIDFYDRDSSSSGRILLGKTILPSTTRFSDACAVESYVIKMSSTRRVFVYLNADLQQFEDVLQNNRASVDYIPFDISFMPPILEVNRGESTPIDFMRQGDSIYNLLWTPSSSLSCSTCFTPFINTAISQRIMLRASTLYQCVDSTILDVKAFYQSHISLPNIFTPNGDGRNDYFYVIAGKQVSRVASFQILSRWGETIFEISNIAPNVIQNGWNGTRRGAPVPQGTYIYLIVIELVGGEKQTYKGNVTVVR